MRCNLGLISYFFNGFDAMQDARSRRPQFYFVKKPEKLYPFAIVPFAMLFDVFFRFHALNFRIMFFRNSATKTRRHKDIFNIHPLCLCALVANLNVKCKILLIAVSRFHSFHNHRGNTDLKRIV
jgi:hypothetical protein